MPPRASMTKKVSMGNGVAASAAVTPIDTSSRAIEAIASKLKAIKPAIYKRESAALKQLHELRIQIESIYNAPNLSADEEVPAKDVLDAVIQIDKALATARDKKLLTKEDIDAQQEKLRAEAAQKDQAMGLRSKKAASTSSSTVDANGKRGRGRPPKNSSGVSSASAAKDRAVAKMVNASLKKKSLSAPATLRRNKDGSIAKTRGRKPGSTNKKRKRGEEDDDEEESNADEKLALKLEEDDRKYVSSSEDDEDDENIDIFAFSEKREKRYSLQATKKQAPKKALSAPVGRSPSKKAKTQ